MVVFFLMLCLLQIDQNCLDRLRKREKHRRPQRPVPAGEGGRPAIVMFFRQKWQLLQLLTDLETTVIRCDSVWKLKIEAVPITMIRFEESYFYQLVLKVVHLNIDLFTLPLALGAHLLRHVSELVNHGNKQQGQHLVPVKRMAYGLRQQIYKKESNKNKVSILTIRHNILILNDIDELTRSIP